MASATPTAPPAAGSPVLRLARWLLVACAAAAPAAQAAPPPEADWGYTTTRFSDGWVSTVRPDWVEVSKGPLKVLLHHAREEDRAYMSVLQEQTALFWKLLVAPRYQSVGPLFVERFNVGGYQPANVAAGDLVESASGRKVYVVLYSHKGRGTRWMEFVAPDRASFEREFGPYRQDDTDWNRWGALMNSNRFALAPKDLAGTWSDNFASATALVYAASGRSAGMLYTGGNTEIAFDGGRYTMSITSAVGQAPNIRVQTQTYSGTYTLPDAWAVAFDNNFEGRTRRFKAAFEAVAGGRVMKLVLDEPGAPITLNLVRVR